MERGWKPRLRATYGGRSSYAKKPMKKSILIISLSLIATLSPLFLYRFRVETDLRHPTAPPTDVFSHDLLDTVLQTYVDDAGGVNYTALKANPEQFEAYLDLLATADPTTFSYNEQLAFWVNAYNALVIKGVIDRYPITSVRDVKPFNGFFYRLKFHVAGETYTLQQIEHDILRKEFVDPRIHFVLVCASSGCPPLWNRAFSAETIEDDMETATFNFILDPRRVRVDRATRSVYLSKIFHWYADDFKEGYDGVTDFLSDYLSPEDAAFIAATEVQLRDLDYDWTLNDQKNTEK